MLAQLFLSSASTCLLKSGWRIIAGKERILAEIKLIGKMFDCRRIRIAEYFLLHYWLTTRLIENSLRVGSTSDWLVHFLSLQMLTYDFQPRGSSSISSDGLIHTHKISLHPFCLFSLRPTLFQFNVIFDVDINKFLIPINDTITSESN